MGIFRVGPDGLNLGSIIETLNQQARPPSWCNASCRDLAGRQARAGDRRQGCALLPGPHPAGSEIRGNLAAGGKGVAQPISERDREIAEPSARCCPRAACC
jgi:glutathione synthase